MTSCNQIQQKTYIKRSKKEKIKPVLESVRKLRRLKTITDEKSKHLENSSRKDNNHNSITINTNSTQSLLNASPSITVFLQGSASYLALIFSGDQIRID